MPYDRPSLTELINRIDNDFSVRVDDSQTFLQNSVFKIFSKVLGGSDHLLYDYIEFVKDQLFISTADGETLEKHGAEYGIFREVGEKATGSVIATGTDGLIIEADSELQSSTGNAYKVLEDTTIVAGDATISIEASEVGTDYNEIIGVVLTFSNPVPGISSTATVLTGGIDGGIDADTDEEFQTTILNRKRFPPHGGIETDYVDWALQYSGTITRAWTIPEYQGIGTIGLAFVKDNSDPVFPTETENAAVKAYIISHTDSAIGKDVGIPVTATPGFFMITLVPYTINLTLKVYPNNSTVQTAINTKVEELIKQESAPGGTIALSKISEAISNATDEEKHKITYPTDDIAVSTQQLHYMGIITYEDYS